MNLIDYLNPVLRVSRTYCPVRILSKRTRDSYNQCCRASPLLKLCSVTVDVAVAMLAFTRSILTVSFQEFFSNWHQFIEI